MLRCKRRRPNRLKSSKIRSYWNFINSGYTVTTIQPVWIDMVKFRHLGKKLPKLLGNFLRMLLVSNNISNLLWQKIAIGQIFTVVNDQIFNDQSSQCHTASTTMTLKIVPYVEVCLIVVNKVKNQFEDHFTAKASIVFSIDGEDTNLGLQNVVIFPSFGQDDSGNVFKKDVSKWRHSIFGKLIRPLVEWLIVNFIRKMVSFRHLLLFHTLILSDRKVIRSFLNNSR